MGLHLNPMLAGAAMGCSSLFVVSNALRLKTVSLAPKQKSLMNTMNTKGEEPKMKETILKSANHSLENPWSVPTKS